MDREKFRQKALKQTEQKKSKSAEFLMVTGDTEAAEGTGNPAFNASSPGLSMYQAAEDVGRHATLDAAHQQEFRLPTSAEAEGRSSRLCHVLLASAFGDRNLELLDHQDNTHQGQGNCDARQQSKSTRQRSGNESGRNYFDPLREEEAHPRQCGMEVSGEGERELTPPHVDNRILSDGLMKLFDESDESGCGGDQDESLEKEPPGPEEQVHPAQRRELHREEDVDATSAAKEDFARYAREDPVLVRGSSLQQDLKSEGELNQHIPMLCLKTDATFENQPPVAEPGVCKEDNTAHLGTPTEGRLVSSGAAGPRREVAWSQSPQPFQMRMKCIRGLKNKAPPGSYLLKVSLLGRPGDSVLPWWPVEKLKTRTHPVRHEGNFHDVGLYFHESLYVALPPERDVKPGMAFLFELVLLRGKYECLDQVVGWSVFPLCDSNLDIVEGKFKCPLLRGRYDQKLDNFRKIEDLICLDLDHWLCNLYFQVIKLPLCFDDQKTHARHTQLPRECPVCLMAEARATESGLGNTTEFSEKENQEDFCASMSDEASSSLRDSQGSVSQKIGSCPVDRDLDLLKEDRESHTKGESLTDHSVKEESTAWRTGEIKDYSQDTSYLEELEEHRFAVCCSSVADSTGSGEFFKHLHFVLVSVFSELQLAQWRSQSFWYIILLVASLWFLRLYLHYLGQWLFLRAISAPVTKFHFSPLTVELCYPPSSLYIREELLVVAVGPLTLNAVMLPLVLIRWGCQLQLAYCPDALSKLIITMGLWTILDPLAVFIVDTVLGRLTHNGDALVADAAKLYWVFVRTSQSGIPGAVLAALIYTLLFIVSSLIFYVYCLRLNSDSWILDAFQRIHSEETKFFIPYDLEISNQELSYIVKRSEQWRGINGERRQVAVYDYIWNSHGVQSSVSSCDLRRVSAVSASALGPGDITSHVAVYTVYPSGFQELHRHFLRLPGGAIVEVFGDVRGFQILPRALGTAIQDRIRERDSALDDSSDIRSPDMKRIR